MFVVIMPIFYEHVGRGRTTTTASDIDLALASLNLGVGSTMIAGLASMYL